MMQHRVIVVLLIFLCIWEGTAHNGGNTVPHQERKQRDHALATIGNDFEEQENEEGVRDQEELPSSASYLLYTDLLNGSATDLLMKRKAKVTSFSNKKACNALTKGFGNALALLARIRNKLDIIQDRLKAKKPSAGIKKECESEGNLYHKSAHRCYFLTKDDDYFNPETCSSHKAGSTLASIPTPLLDDIIDFLRGKLDPDDDFFEVRAWTWGSYDPTIGKKNKSIRWGDGKTVELVGEKLEKYWFPDAPFTVDERDHYEEYTRIVIAVRSNEEDANQGIYNHPGTHFKPSLCVYE